MVSEDKMAPRIKEYRIPMRMDVDDYRKGQLFTTVEASKKETGDGEGVELVCQNDFNDKNFVEGQYKSGTYTKKIFHLHRHLPRWLRWAISPEKCQFVEEAWNAYPYCLTEVRNPNFLKEDFYIIFESIHLPFNGTFEDNALKLSDKEIKRRVVEVIDITRDDQMKKEDYKAEIDPKVTSVGGMVLDKDWLAKGQATMCCYKVIKLLFRWKGLTTKINNFALGPTGYTRVFSKFNKELYCTMDVWSKLSLTEIRAIELDLKEELERLRKSKDYRGTDP